MKGWHNYTKHATDGVPNTAFSTMPGTPFMAQLLALPYAMVACTGLGYAAASACTAEETMTIVDGTSGDDAYQVLGPLTQGCNDCVQDAGNGAALLRENCWPVVSGNQCHSTLSFYQSMQRYYRGGVSGDLPRVLPENAACHGTAGVSCELTSNGDGCEPRAGGDCRYSPGLPQPEVHPDCERSSLS